MSYNTTDGPDERNAIFKLLDWYIKIDKQHLPSCAILQYAELAKIEPRSDRDIQLLKSLLSYISSLIPKNRFPVKNVGKALYRALMWVDPAVIDDVSSLLTLAEKLLSSLCSPLELGDELFEEYEGIFLALRLTVYHIQRVAGCRLCWLEKQKLRTAIAKKRRLLKEWFEYYPARFHFELLEQSIKDLGTRKNPPFFMRMLQLSALESCDTVRILCGFGSKFSEKISGPTLEERIEKVKEISNASTIRESQCHTLVQNLTALRLQTMNDETNMALFKVGFNALLKSQRKIKGREAVKKLRFALIHELSELSAFAASRVQENADEELLTLTNEIALRENWLVDADILEAVIDAVYRARTKEDCSDEIADCSDENADMLEALSTTSTSSCKSALLMYSGSSSAEEELHTEPELEMDLDHRQDLLTTFGKEVGCDSIDEVHHDFQNLKDKYLDNAFAMVSTLGNNRGCRHVIDLQHHIVIYKNVVKNERCDQNTELRCLNDPSTEHSMRVDRETEKVALEDLFKPRSLGADIPSEIHRVLLYGEHGSGKTSVGKSIAHRWAKGGFMENFRVILMASVRELERCRKDDQGWKTLEEAIAKLCFPARCDSKSDTRTALVDDALGRADTLLILDDVDEGNDGEKSMVLEVQRRQCKTLFLCRSHNIGNIKSDIDVEMECLRLVDGEARTYMSELLPGSG